jgi:tRNA (cytidine32/guanosine34-2'-O)-methyltransferase
MFFRYGEDVPLIGPSSVIVPFVACGDINGYDADKSYPLQLSQDEGEYVYHEPVQPPIHPNYHTYLQRQKQNQQQQQQQQEKG